MTTYFSSSSGRTATGDSGKGPAGTPATGVAGLKGEQPANTAPEDTGGPGKSSFWESLKNKVTFWQKEKNQAKVDDDITLKGNDDETAVQLGKNTKLEVKQTLDGETSVKVGYGPAAVSLQGGESKLTGEVEVGKKLGDAVEAKAGAGATLDATKGTETEGTVGRVTTFASSSSWESARPGASRRGRRSRPAPTTSGSGSSRPARTNPDRVSRQAQYDQVEGQREGAPEWGENWRAVHGR